jgi:hypothetical protein
MAQGRWNVTGKWPVKGNSRTLGFSVTFTRGKRACILAVLGMSLMSRKPQNYLSAANPTSRLACLSERDVRLFLPEASNRTEPATALEVL